MWRGTCSSGRHSAALIPANYPHTHTHTHTDIWLTLSLDAPSCVWSTGPTAGCFNHVDQLSFPLRGTGFGNWKNRGLWWVWGVLWWHPSSRVWSCVRVSVFYSILFLGGWHITCLIIMIITTIIIIIRIIIIIVIIINCTMSKNIIKYYYYVLFVW